MRVIISLTVILFASRALAQMAVVTLTAREYQEIVEATLPCPPPAEEAGGSWLCLRVLPPGHRERERELLIVVRTKEDGSLQMELKQPLTSIASAATDAKTADQPNWRHQFRSEVRSWQTSDRVQIERILGRGWRNIMTPLMPAAEWLVDPTRYQVLSNSMSGTLAMEVAGPGAAARRQGSVFLRWAEGARQRAELRLQSGSTGQ